MKIGISYAFVDFSIPFGSFSNLPENVFRYLRTAHLTLPDTLNDLFGFFELCRCFTSLTSISLFAQDSLSLTADHCRALSCLKHVKSFSLHRVDIPFDAFPVLCDALPRGLTEFRCCSFVGRFIKASTCFDEFWKKFPDLEILDIVIPSRATEVGFECVLESRQFLLLFNS